MSLQGEYFLVEIFGVKSMWMSLATMEVLFDLAVIDEGPVHIKVTDHQRVVFED